MPNTPALHVAAAIEDWPLQTPFVISRGAKTSAQVVVATIIDDDGVLGRGECVPYARYGETPDAILDTIQHWQPHPDRDVLLKTLPPGAARNALDCALWDYHARRSGTSVAAALNVTPPSTAVETAFTLSLGPPDAMAEAASAARPLKLLKLKLGGDDRHDEERMRAVRAARPDARLIGDANEGWAEDETAHLLAVAADLGFELIEQPRPAGQDAVLATISSPVAVCADESCHTAKDLQGLVGKYAAVNIKLDKAGGLTAAYDAVQTARQLHFEIMIGSMVATSLAVAPAHLLAGFARWVDLDGPLLLARDRAHGFTFNNGYMQPADGRLWGS